MTRPLGARKLGPRGIAVALSILAFAQGMNAARATLVVPLDLNALTDGADRIVVAQVERQQARFTADRSTIFTEVTLRVIEAVKGAEVAVGDTVVVWREGGELEGQGVRVIGAAGFADGEEVLLFLERRGSRKQATASPMSKKTPLYVMGMAQGKLRVERRAAGPMVVRQREGLGFTQANSAAALEPAVEPLAEVLRKVRQRLSASHPQRKQKEGK